VAAPPTPVVLYAFGFCAIAASGRSFRQSARLDRATIFSEPFATPETLKVISYDAFAGVCDGGTHSMGVTAERDDFAQVFQREFPRLAGYCAGLVGDRELGADLAQEALART
jgi:hypothetical protein